MKKTLKGILVLTVLTGLLAGCVSGEDLDQSTAKDSGYTVSETYAIKDIYIEEEVDRETKTSNGKTKHKTEVEYELKLETKEFGVSEFISSNVKATKGATSDTVTFWENEDGANMGVNHLSLTDKSYKKYLELVEQEDND